MDESNSDGSFSTFPWHFEYLTISEVFTPPWNLIEICQPMNRLLQRKQAQGNHISLVFLGIEGSGVITLFWCLVWSLGKNLSKHHIPQHNTQLRHCYWNCEQVSTRIYTLFYITMLSRGMEALVTAYCLSFWSYWHFECSFFPARSRTINCQEWLCSRKQQKGMIMYIWCSSK